MARLPSSPADQKPQGDNPSAPRCAAAGSRAHRRRWGLLLACGLVAAALAGCGAQEEIRTYEVPREPNVRMLAAIVPSGKAVWFIKVAGPDPVVEQHKKAFKEFVQSLRFDLEKDPPVTWELPKGWQEERDDRKRDRKATIRLGAKENGGLELTVTVLRRDGQAASVVANVNRWRGQLGLAPITRAEFDRQLETKAGAEKLPVGQDEAILVDMVGTGPYLVSQGFFVAPPTPARPRFDTPKGWEAAKPKEFSVATFRTGKGEGTAEVTVSKMGGGLLLNANRWRGQVGLPPVDEEQLLKELQTLEVAGEKSPYVEYQGVYRDKGEFNGKNAIILGAAVAGDGVHWYLKMTGPPNVVAAQRAAFEAFVRSVKFE